MLDKIKVKDVYLAIDDYPNVSQHAPIDYAIHMMHNVLEDRNKYRTILVIDDDEHLQGYLSLRDLIRAVGPDYLHKRHPDVKGNQPFELAGFDQDLSILSSLWQEGFTKKLHEELSKPVAGFMTLMQDQVSLEDHMSKPLSLMLFHDVLVIPVVQDERVIGVVRLVDLFERIADSVDKVWLPKQGSGK